MTSMLVTDILTLINLGLRPDFACRYGIRHWHMLSPCGGKLIVCSMQCARMESIMRRPKTPEIPLDSDDTKRYKRCAADGCIAEGIYPAPKSRHELRDYLWFCLDHVRAYNKSWNYYEGLQGAALEAEIRRATTWERPSWKFATGKPGDEMFDDAFNLFDFENREEGQQRKS